MNDKNMNYTWLLVQLKFMYNGIYTTSKAPSNCIYSVCILHLISIYKSVFKCELKSNY